MTSSQSDQEALFTRVILQIFQTNGQMIAWGDQFTHQFGVTSARWQMLGALFMATAPLTAPQIADRMGVTRQGAQKQLNLLLTEGLISKKTNPDHKRSPFYQLTETGDALYQQIAAKWQKHTESIGQEISPDEQELVLKVLKKIHQLHAPNLTNPTQGAKS